MPRYKTLFCSCLSASIIFLFVFFYYQERNEPKIKRYLQKQRIVTGEHNTSFDTQSKNNTSFGAQSKNNTSFDAQLIKKLIVLASEIRKAKQHVRGTKTSDALIKAYATMDSVLHMFHLDVEKVTGKQPRESNNVCPEVYKGPRYDYPAYNKGFESTNCTFGKPLNSLITVVMLIEDANLDFKALELLLSSIRSFDKQIPIIFGSNNRSMNFKLKEISTKFQFSTYVSLNTSKSKGEMWNTLISYVTTKYTFIARGIIWFNHDSRLDRLIREIERLNVTTAGGAFRDTQGHWFMGCQQNVLRNFTLVYEAGYDTSEHECVFCDHIDGPFVIDTYKLNDLLLSEKIQGEGLFEDFYLRISGENVVCPDAMFFVNHSARSTNVKAWTSFSDMWSLFKLTFSGNEMWFSCPKKYKCYFYKGSALTPCCQKELLDLLVRSTDIYESSGTIYEVNSGSLIGLVKLNSVLPWEVDADIDFVSESFTSIFQAKANWTAFGYKFQNDSSKNKFVEVTSPNWFIEMWGMPFVTSQPKYSHINVTTKISLNGKWVRCPRNPGLFVRNRYGKEMFQHAQHWRQLKLKDDKIPYPVNKFLPCGKPGHQTCLDRYNADGNLQFRDPIP